MGFNWKGRRVAVLGGDGREIVIVDWLVAGGASVRTCGLMAGGAEASGHPAAATVAEAVAGAEVIICPAPYPQADGSIFTEDPHEKLYVNTETLRGVAAWALLLTSRASEQMRAGAQALGLHLEEYDYEADLAVLRAPAVAEGAIRVAIEQAAVTLHQNPCLVTGFGAVGSSLARMLVGIGARVTVAARNPVQLAAAYALGCETIGLEQVIDVAPGMAVIFNTARTVVLTRAVLARLGPQTVCIDISGPPGGTDWAAAKELGIPVTWARGMPKWAPKTVGDMQCKILQRVADRHAAD